MKLHGRARTAVTVLFATAAVGATSPSEFAVEVTPASLVLAPARVNGLGPFSLIVDTGSTTTMLDNEVAAIAAVRATGVLEIVTAAGAFRAPTGLIDELAVGPFGLRSLRVGWMSLREMRRIDRRITGVLGQDVLSRFTLTLDYRRGTARLDRQACSRGDATAPVEWAGGRPMVHARLRGSPLPAEGGMVLDSAANAVIVFAAGSRNDGRVAVGTHQASIAATAVDRAHVEIAGVRLTVPAVVMPARSARVETGLIPTALFASVCIDGPRQTATLTR